MFFIKKFQPFIIPALAMAGTLSSFATPAFAESAPPKLAIILVIDQFNSDLYPKTENFLLPPGTPQNPGGFRFLTKYGAYYPHAEFDHAPLHTAVGHASISTGAYPGEHGIVSNYTLSGEGERISSCGDPHSKLVGTGEKEARQGYSPRRLQTTTLGDALVQSYQGNSQVVGISLKERASILTSGSAAKIALWLDKNSGRWVTSDYYTPELPQWVQNFNKDYPPSRFFGTTWKAQWPLLKAIAKKDTHGVADEYLNWGEDFPHLLTAGKKEADKSFYEMYMGTPGGVQDSFALARKAIEHYQLGQDRYPDLLTLSISPTDVAGHIFGPESREKMELFLETDRELADFLLFLDQKIGLENVVLACTGDHGCLPIPEHLDEIRVPSGRLTKEDLIEVVESTFDRVLGESDHVVGFEDPYFHFSTQTLKNPKFYQAADQSVLALKKIEGIENAYNCQRFEQKNLTGDRAGLALQKSYFPGISGPLAIALKTNYIISFAVPKGTTHGTIHNYDSRVPVWLMGAQTNPGVYHDPSSPKSIPVTLSDILGITPPSFAKFPPLPHQPRKR